MRTEYTAFNNHYCSNISYCLLQSVHLIASPECKATSSSDKRRLKRKTYMEM